MNEEVYFIGKVSYATLMCLYGFFVRAHKSTPQAHWVKERQTICFVFLQNIVVNVRGDKGAELDNRRRVGANVAKADGESLSCAGRKEETGGS